MSLPFHLRRAIDRLGRGASDDFVRDVLRVRNADPALVEVGVAYHHRREVR